MQLRWTNSGLVTELYKPMCKSGHGTYVWSSVKPVSSCRNSLEDNLAQLNAEHVKILVCIGRYHCMTSGLNDVQNELVMSRLRHEELESELVRYKLLYVQFSRHFHAVFVSPITYRYAEAMHQSEDAMSTQRVSRMSLFSRRSSNNTA